MIMFGIHFIQLSFLYVNILRWLVIVSTLLVRWLVILQRLSCQRTNNVLTTFTEQRTNNLYSPMFHQRFINVLSTL